MATTTSASATATCSVLLCLEQDTVTVTSSTGKSVTLSLPVLRKSNRTLYTLLVDDDSIVDGESVEVVLTYEQMRTVRDLSKVKPATTLVVPSAPVVEHTIAPAPTVVPLVIAPAKVSHNGTEQVKDTVKRLETSNVFGNVSSKATTERKVRAIQRVLSKIQGQPLYVVNYYIPVELSTAQYAKDEETGEWLLDKEGQKIKTHDIRIPSPAGDFRKVAISLDGSNWFMTEEGLNSKIVQDFFALVSEYADFRGVAGKGARSWAVKQDKDESQKLVEWAMEELRCHLVQVHTTLLESIDKANEGLADAEKKWQATLVEGGRVGDKEEATEWAKRNNRVRKELSDAAEKLNDALKLAEKYDATECVEDLFQALRHAIRSNEATFNASVEGKFTPTGRPVKGSNVGV